jgi:hypothetical protein
MTMSFLNVSNFEGLFMFPCYKIKIFYLYVAYFHNLNTSKLSFSIFYKVRVIIFLIFFFPYL